MSPEFRPKKTPSAEQKDTEEKEIIKKPFEKPKAPSLTFFREIFHEKMGILRSSYHQNDKSFSKHPGKQSLANAVAALAMLREFKSRTWIPKTVDDIMIAGEIYYIDCKKESETEDIKVTDLVDKIKINKNLYKPKVDDTGIIGRLNSLSFQTLDLCDALDEFFINHDTGK